MSRTPTTPAPDGPGNKETPMPATPDQTGVIAAPGHPADYLAIQRAALVELLRLARDAVAPTVREVEERRQHALESADRILSERLAALSTLVGDRRTALEQRQRKKIDAIQAEFDSSTQALNESTRAELRRIAADLREVEAEARSQLEDQLLLADTVAAATIQNLRGEIAALEQQLTDHCKRLAALDSRTSEVLARFRWQPPADHAAEPPAPVGTDPALEFARTTQLVEHQIAALAQLGLPRLLVPPMPALLLILIALAALGVAVALNYLGLVALPIGAASAIVAGEGLALLAAPLLRRRARRAIQREMRPLVAARAAAERAREQLAAQYAERRRRHEAHIAALQRLNPEKIAAQNRFDSVSTQARGREADQRFGLEQAYSHRQAEIEQRRRAALEQAQAEHDRACASLTAQEEQESAAIRQQHAARIGEIRARYETDLGGLRGDWNEGLARLRRLLEETPRVQAAWLTDWEQAARAEWRPPAASNGVVPFGSLELDAAELAPAVREGVEFLADYTGAVRVPAVLALPQRGSLLVQTGRAGRAHALHALRAVMLRLLTSFPAGRVRFILLDPVGLGETFAGFMHLADYEEALVGGRVWTEGEHIEARLAELTSHMENVIQKYLRNEFATIDAYNRQAGELAEPYRFLVIADFPANFSDGAARRLASIVSSGARCGVFTLIAQDQRISGPPGLQLEDIAAGSVHIVHDGGGFKLADEVLGRFPLTLDQPPAEDVLTRIMHSVGRAAKDALRVEVPFAAIAPRPEQLWQRESAGGLEAPIGNAGAVRLQQFRLGRGLAQHALVAGKTGSGKSTLLHVIVTNLALWYSPDEVELYLVDFKKGVEFKTYVTNRLPHARVIAIESDREFGVSVLQRLDAEMSRRGELFRAAGVQDVAAFRAPTGRRLARILLIVDEFQIYFAEDDKLAQDAGVLLDRLVRQGRAFGIHALLGSQTLGGTAGLPRSTLGQMAVRIALQCSEADAQLILDDTNVAARLLSRPGEAIYNDAGGRVEGNSAFQVAWLPDDERNGYLARVAAHAGRSGTRTAPPVVFEGNAPADVRQNLALERFIEAPHWPARPAPPRAWLGEPVAIKEPTGVTFQRQSGANLLVVGQRDDAARCLLETALLGMAVQNPPQAARFVILPGAAGEERTTPAFRRVLELLPHAWRLVEWRDVPEVLAELAGELRRRLETRSTTEPSIFVVVNGLQRYRMLRRREESFSFSARDDEGPATDRQFAELLREGPPLGLHVLAWSDTLATLERTLDRAALGEFDHRVLFQLSAADSSNLIDSPEANRLGMHRALLFSQELGLLEKFRPYGPPDTDWLEHVRTCIAARGAPAQ